MNAWEFFTKAHSEDNGNPSSSRLNNTYALVVFVTMIAWGYWMVVKFYSPMIPEYLVSLVTLVGGILGISVWRKKNEAKVPPEDPKPTDQPPTGH